MGAGLALAQRPGWAECKGLISMGCGACGAIYEALPTIAGGGMKECLSCGSEDVSRRFDLSESVSVRAMVDEKNMEEGEIKMLLRNKAHIESKYAETLTGAIDYVEAGPREFRPERPKRFF